MTLGTRILNLLRDEGGWVSSLDIVTAMEKAGVRFARGRVYPALRRLADEGRLERRAVPGGPDRAYIDRIVYRLATTTEPPASA
jgi:DNA-binding PadR family transcriptional regulator